MIHPPRWLRRAPVVREPLRRLAKRHAPAGPIELTVGGLGWSLAPRDNKVDFDLWYKRRLPEAQECAFLARHLGAGDLFVDIGSNIGLYCVVLLSAVPGLEAAAFEPIERLRMRQSRNLKLNGLADRAVLSATAVGPQGTMTLHQSRNAGRASLVPFDGSRGSITVAVQPLADLLDRAPAAIKIDVEGFEADALMPYFDVTPPDRWPRAIVIETLHHALWRRDCLQELARNGYVLAGGTDENACLLLTT